PFIKNGRIERLTKYYDRFGWRDRFYKAAIQQLTFDDEIYSVPLTVNNVNLFYNKLIFAQFNLKPPVTFEDLFQVADILNSNGIFPIVWGNRYRWTGMDYFHILAGQTSGDLLKKADAGTVAFTHPGFIEAMEALKLLIDKDVFAPGINAMSDGDVRQLFYFGKAAMFLGGTWCLVDINENAPPDIELGLIQFPVIKSGYSHVSSGGVGMNVVVNINSPRKELALKFIDFFTSTEEQKRYVYEVQATSSNIRANVDEVIRWDLLRIFNQFQTNTVPRVLYTKEYWDAIADGIQLLVENEKTPIEVLQEVEKLRLKITDKVSG
ncbi:MAG: ABC transporter substrate-binding protein, partial [Fidelibacterota bacterium]